MYDYTIHQWCLIFFIYSIMGWIWECLYVSARQKKWINRGFMHGPFLPIYGVGAVLLLKVAGPFGLDWWKIYLIGMISCTVMEFVTGLLMESFFQVRYWNYSHEPLNIKGHVCLGVSMTWGAVAIFLNAFIHRPVEKLIFNMSDALIETSVELLIIVFVIDFTLSFIEAIDLKNFLEQLAQSNEVVRGIQQKIDELYAVVEAGVEGLAEKFKEDKSEIGPEKKKYFERLMDWSKQEKVGQMAELRNKISTYLKKTNSEKVDNDKIGVNEEELKTFEEQLFREEIKLENKSEREFRRLAGLLRRNPNAVSKRHKNELSELLKLTFREKITQKKNDKQKGAENKNEKKKN